VRLSVACCAGEDDGYWIDGGAVEALDNLRLHRMLKCYGLDALPMG
jgi:hypothetical protein